MADIIELRSRGTSPVRVAEPVTSAPPVADAWLLPWAMLRLGVESWATWWLAPLGLRVERSESER